MTKLTSWAGSKVIKNPTKNIYLNLSFIKKIKFFELCVEAQRIDQLLPGISNYHFSLKITTEEFSNLTLTLTPNPKP